MVKMSKQQLILRKCESEIVNETLITLVCEYNNFYHKKGKKK